MDLQHHGIEGQKWGKKNGPPYPLSYNDYSPAEKKQYKRYQNKMIAYEKDSMKNRTVLNAKAWNKTVESYDPKAFEKVGDETWTINGKKVKIKNAEIKEDYVKDFENKYHLNYDKMLMSELESNSNYKEAQKIVEQYSYLKVSDIYIKNTNFINDVKKANSKGKTSWDLDMKKYLLN